MNEICLMVVLRPSVKGHPHAPKREGPQDFEYHEIEELAQHFDLLIKERNGELFLVLDSKHGSFN